MTGAPVALVGDMLRKRPRLRTFDYLGRYRYFLTFCTHLRSRPFTTRPNVDLVLKHFLHAAERHGFQIPAYCFMPDHAHLLAEGSDDNSDLKEFVKLAKQRSGFAYARLHGTRLWQPSFYDHVLRDDESSLWVIAYILRNPIVAGIAAGSSDYPFLGSGTMSLSELIVMLQEGLGPDWETRDLLPVRQFEPQEEQEEKGGCENAGRRSVRQA